MTEVLEQLRQALSAQTEPQGWHLSHIQEDPLEDTSSFYLGMYPEKKDDLYAVYTVAWTHDTVPGFLNCCKVYVFKDGKARPLEWWGQWM